MKLVIVSSYEGLKGYQEVPTPSMEAVSLGIDPGDGTEIEEAKKTIKAFLDLPDVQLSLEWDFDNLLTVYSAINRLISALEAEPS